MKNSIKLSQFICVLGFVLFTIPNLDAQTKKIKRPKNTVGISSVDNFVSESFDLYDKVYMYDGYAAEGKSLEEEDIDILEDALENVTTLTESAPDILADLDGVSVLKQGKATLHINRAKKALKYSLKTSKELLLGQGERNETNSEENTTKEKTSTNESSSSSSKNDSTNKTNDVKPELKIYSKFDYVPGDKLLFFEDFSNDFIGDFPARWNTNGSGEIVTINDSGEKWLMMKPGYGTAYIPDLPKDLPEEFTIEFDIETNGIDEQTSSASILEITLDDNFGFDNGQNYVYVTLPFCQYVAQHISFNNRINGDMTINNSIDSDIRKAITNNPHISIAVNKQRFRLWVNEKKYVDVPRMVGINAPLKSLKFASQNFKDGKEQLFIKNIKVAEGGLDLRRTLIANGKVSTNGILFDSGSANIQPQSYGIIRQISQVLQQEKDMKLNIVGHTDADGSDNNNLKLSKSRAEAVKKALIEIYNISADRLQTDGKGESQPVGDNATSDGKAQNRRVEFIKI